MNVDTVVYLSTGKMNTQLSAAGNANYATRKIYLCAQILRFY